MKRFYCLMFLSVLAGTLNAQWTVKESDFKGSPLVQIYKASPYLVHIMPDAEWNNSNFASEADMKWYKEARYGMYIHFGLGAYKNRDLSWGMADGVAPDKSEGAYPRSEWTSWPDRLKLEKFSKEELADIIRKSGMKYVVVVAKHHDGFHFYDTQYSDFKVTNTPYGKDFVKEVVDACRMANVKVGFYFSQRDWYHPDYEPIDTTTIERISSAPYFRAKEGKIVKPGKKHRKYIEYMFNTVRELCTNYGKIDMFNFDASYWNGMFTADMWDAEQLTRMIRELQPGIIINNRASLPGDYDSPEQRIGMFQDRRMWETCMCLCDTWAYSPTRVKGPLEVFRNIQSTAIGNGNVLLSWGMKWNGEWDEKQKNSLIDAGEFLEAYGESIYKTHGGPWLPESWGGTTFRNNKIYVHVFQSQIGIISLPKLPVISIEQCKVLTGQTVEFKDGGDHYELDCKLALTEKAPLIIELTASRNLTSDDILRQPQAGGLFGDEKTYGKRICSQVVATSKDIVIDLGGKRNLKGVQLVSEEPTEKGNVSIWLSEGENTWKLYQTLALTGTNTEIPITTYVAGILVEGIATQKIKLQFASGMASNVICHVYGN